MDLKNSIKSNFAKPSRIINDLHIFKLQMNASKDNRELKLQKYTIGKTNLSYPTKIILLIGETGTGKTTLINAMTNYMFNVEFQDDFRFELLNDTDNQEKKSEAHSQTDFINCYEFNYMNGMPFEYNYVIIDTPGFGDTRGIQRDKEMMLQLEQFFRQDYGVTHLDAIGIVTVASSARLTETQKYIFTQLTSMFGVDVKNIIYIMATFADGSDRKVDVCLKEAQVPYSDIFEFNNGALYGPHVEKSGVKKGKVRNNKNFWEMGSDNMTEFFEKFPKSKGVSLKLTQSVMEKKRLLEEIVSGMPDKIKKGLDMVNEVEKHRDELLKADQELMNMKKQEDEMSQGVATSKSLQWVGFGFGLLVGLPVLLIMGSKYKEAQKSLEEFRKKVSTSTTSKNDKVNALKELEKTMEELTNSVLHSILEARNHALTLQEISLKTGTISVIEYIETLIERENTMKNSGYTKRIETMEKIKKQATMIEKLRTDEALGKVAHDKEGFLKELNQEFEKM